jgi:hypothetical protein
MRRFATDYGTRIGMAPTPLTLLRTAGLVFSSAMLILPTVWGALALWYRISAARVVKALAAAAWAAFGFGMLILAWEGRVAIAASAYAFALAMLLIWWRRLRPTHDGEWAEELAMMTAGTIDGNRVTLRNVRNFEWRTTSDYTPRWETRSYDLDRLKRVDMVMSYWRGPAIAHMVISFGFDDGSHVAFSVEIRRRRTQEFSEIGGFFKEFELCIIAADELDAIWLRANTRGERVYLYELRLAPEARRSLFLSYVSEANGLLQTPRFYHTITANCTTLVYQMMRRIVGPLPLSHGLLFSGYMPEYVYRVGGLDRRRTLEELRQRGYISERARRCGRGPGFSASIRDGYLQSGR